MLGEKSPWDFCRRHGPDIERARPLCPDCELRRQVYRATTPDWPNSIDKEIKRLRLFVHRRW